jgi:hypothetical protein
MRTTKTLLTANLFVLLFTLILCSNSQACWRFRCRQSCGPQFGGGWSYCQPTCWSYCRPTYVDSCPDGYVPVYCNVDGYWAQTDLNNAVGCADPNWLNEDSTANWSCGAYDCPCWKVGSNVLVGFVRDKNTEKLRKPKMGETPNIYLPQACEGTYCKKKPKHKT